MAMSEEQAKTKWCPMLHIARVTQNFSMPTRSNCLASDCMMWQWKVVNNQYDDPDAPKEGYCGLTR